MTENENRYLSILAKQYSTEEDATAEIINLQAILCRPKGTEHYLTDIHGEAEQFRHVLKNSFGIVKRQWSDRIIEIMAVFYILSEKAEIVNRQVDIL